MPKQLLLIIVLLCIVIPVFSQDSSSTEIPRSKTEPAAVAAKSADSSCITWKDSIPEDQDNLRLEVRDVCKGYHFTYPAFPQVEILPSQPIVQVYSRPPKKVSSLLQVTGNILYDVNYRSRIDTPYAENNVYQHTLQTRLDFLYKGQYPFRLYLTTHFSNSSLFRNYNDLNLQYTQADFSRLLKKGIMEQVQGLISSKASELDSLRRIIDLLKAQIFTLSQSIKKPDITQQLVEEREKTLFEHPTDKIKADSLWSMLNIRNFLGQKFKFATINRDSVEEFVEELKPLMKTKGLDEFRTRIGKYKEKLDSLVRSLEGAEQLYGKLKSVRQFNLDKLKNKIDSAKDSHSLSQILQQSNIPDSLLPKGYKTLYAIQSFKIGRTILNYSELSVKDISITGIQAEFNPKNYYAFAAGKVDYRFRDYIITNRTRSNQYVALVRFGKGTRNGNHLILTYYTGRRQFFNSSIPSQARDSIPTYHLAGITLEGLYKISRYVSVTGEVAKSTIPYYSLDSMQKKDWIKSFTRFKDRSNEAYSLMLNAYLPKTQTRFNGNFRYIGANFQSFSSFTTGASQVRWLARLEQPFFKKKLTFVSSVQQNDYNNPFVTTAYKSSSVLASFQANLRIRKWPFLSIGYYPSYQLTKINNDNYSENRYYTLVANSGYYYKIRSAQLSTYVVFSKFYNSSSDSGFIYFNSKNLLISQSATFNRVTVQLEASLSANTEYNIYTIENNDQFVINKFLAAGGGVKMIRNTRFNELQWGYSGNVTLKLPKLGNIEVMMDKGFIPGFDRRLVENKMGRLTYFKTF